MISMHAPSVTAVGGVKEGGRWRVAGGRWQVAGGRWEVKRDKT